MATWKSGFDNLNRQRGQSFALAFLLFFVMVSPASATKIRFNTNDLQFYGEGTWRSMNVADTGIGCGGANPGQVRLNSGVSPNRLEFCDATTWRRMDYEVTTDSCSELGKMDWHSLTSMVRFCNGSFWVRTSLATGTRTYFLTSGTGWVVPADWSNTENTIEVIGGGGGDACQGAGGGGGAYSKVTNVTLTPGYTVGIRVGTGGVGDVDGGDTWLCNSTSNCSTIAGSAVVVGAKGGTTGWDGSGGGPGGAAASGVGTVRYSGGRGGDVGSDGSGETGGGGGGAGGPNGDGKNGGNGSSSDDRGGGGGGGGGGSAGAVGTGGNNYLGYGSGPIASNGTVGGGGGGGHCPTYTEAGSGGAGWEWGAFMGSGGGGGGYGWNGICNAGGSSGGLFGGGAGACASNRNKGGGQGVIVIKYKPGPDSNPDAFDFIDVYGASLSTSYQVSAVLTGFSVTPLTVNVSGGDAQVSKNGIGSWGSSVNVNPGDVLNLRMTSSSSPATGITATVTVGDQTVDWLVTTATGVTRNYFVVTNGTTANGNLGGLSGANAFCLSDLLANDWAGKSLVEVNSSTVRAFLCDGSSCNNAVANTTYTFARSGSTSDGGATFTTNGTAQGPGNTTAWNTSSYFGTTAQNYWTGRASTSSSLWSASGDTNHCTNWTSNSSGVNGRRGISNSSTATRWTHGTVIACNDSTRKLICMVDHTTAVDSTPDYFDFVDAVGASLSTQYFVSQRVLGFVGPITASVSGGGAEISVNDSGSWVTSGLVLNPGDIIRVRMTSSGSPSTAVTATVTIGSLVVDWKVDTTVVEYNYFVLTSAAFNGNRGGLTGASSTCVTDLTNNDWIGKSNVAVNSTTVKAWLCDGVSCNDLLPSKTYSFARSGNTGIGGDTFTTNGSGQGPGNTQAWNVSTKLGTTTVTTWSGRAAGVDSAWGATDTNHCTAWSTNSSGVSARSGTSNASNTDRWALATTTACNSSRRMFCSVDYTVPVDTTPNGFDFIDVTGAAASTLYETSQTIWGFVGPVTASVSGPSAEIRSNGTGSWGTSGVTVYPGDTVNVRLTSGTTSLVPIAATVSVGGASADWIVTTADFHVTIFLTSGTNWVVPSNWNNSQNTIEVIGGGGGGAGDAGDKGGGGGGYSFISNVTLTPLGTVAYAVATGGTGGIGGHGSAGGDTYFCTSTSNCASIGGTAVVVGAKGGAGSATGSGGTSATGVGSLKYSGGGVGSTGACGGGGLGGGGSAGPSGNGKRSGNGNCGGSGGGGSNGGLSTVGSNTSGEWGSDGGHGNSGSGGGSGGLDGGSGEARHGLPGSNGGGGGGGGDEHDATPGDGGAGGMQVLWTQTSDGAYAGPGGGGGGGGDSNSTGGVGGAGGGYGGGGGGGAYGLTPDARSQGGRGAPGIIVIRYIP